MTTENKNNKEGVRHVALNEILTDQELVHCANIYNKEPMHKIASLIKEQVLLPSKERLAREFPDVDLAYLSYAILGVIMKADTRPEMKNDPRTRYLQKVFSDAGLCD